MHSLVPAPPPTGLVRPPEYTDAESAAKTYANSARAEATRRAYAADWARFLTWCERCDVAPLPASEAALTAYAAHLAQAGKAPSTIERAVSAVVYVHRRSKLQSPRPRGGDVSETMAGIRAEAARMGFVVTKKAPAMAEDVCAIVRPMGDRLLDLRDRAMVLLGFTGAFRRSELVALDVRDIEDRAQGCKVAVRRSKTDQTGKGEFKGIPFGKNPDTCPVRALRSWLAAAGITQGAVFRGVNRHGSLTKRLRGSDVARIIKQRATAAGLDAKHFAGHSLRAGFVTEAHLRGKSTHSIMKQTGHRNVQTLYGYIRLAELFADNAAEDIGL